MSTQSFRALGVSPEISGLLEQRGIHIPFPIQTLVLPDALAGLDVLAKAPTGSGKTFAFGLPILERAEPADGEPSALVLVPTRELAAQVAAELEPLAKVKKLRVAAVYGGATISSQAKRARGAHVLVATPGRLQDLVERRLVSLARVRVLVLDEADRMLDMGFLPDIRRLLKHLTHKRQTLFFSATMPAPILQLTRELLHDPVTINRERKSAPASGITQAVYPVAQELKSALLRTLITRDIMHQALVFTRTKHRANRLWEFLTKHGLSAARIHGNRSQPQREDALAVVVAPGAELPEHERLPACAIGRADRRLNSGACAFRNCGVGAGRASQSPGSARLWAPGRAGSPGRVLRPACRLESASP